MLHLMLGCVPGTITGELEPPPPADPNGQSAADAGAMSRPPALDGGAAADQGAASGMDAGPQGPVCGDQRCDYEETCDACPADCGPCEVPSAWEAEERAVLALVNQQRAQGANCGGRSIGPAGPLMMNAEVRAAARRHSQDMADQGYFDHTSLDGRSPWDRAAEAGYQGRATSENIAAGNRGAQGTFDQGLNSAGHCANMMSPDAREIGVGYGYNERAEYRHYWTQVFGR